MSKRIIWCWFFGVIVGVGVVVYLGSVIWVFGGGGKLII